MQKIISRFFKSKYSTISIHILFWSFFLFIPHILFDLPLTAHIIGYKVFETSVIGIIFYFNAYYLVPKFLMRRKYIIYFLIVIGLILSFSQIKMLNKPPKFTENPRFEQNMPPPPPDNREFHKDFNKKRGPFIGFIILVTIAISASFSYANQYNKREKELKELEKEQFASELLFLKSQINPHFLFNILNSVYSLSLKKSDDLPEVIIKLSDLLRYMTYESEEKYVNIKKELAYIQNYIDLQKLRFSKESIINISIIEDYEDAKIAPMLFITFIENAFKHGISAEGEIHMDCTIAITNSKIDFDITNTIAKSNHKDAVSGIGIQNVKRRLELLYPQKHSLKIQETDLKFSVNLSINLS